MKLLKTWVFKVVSRSCALAEEEQDKKFYSKPHPLHGIPNLKPYTRTLHCSYCFHCYHGYCRWQVQVKTQEMVHIKRESVVLLQTTHSESVTLCCQIVHAVVNPFQSQVSINLSNGIAPMQCTETVAYTQSLFSKRVTSSLPTLVGIGLCIRVCVCVCVLVLVLPF